MQAINAFLSGKHKSLWNYSPEFCCDSLAEEVPRGTLAVRRLEKNEGQDCWDWLITWRPHIALPQIKVGLC